MNSKLLLLIFGFSFLGGAYSAFPLLHGHPPNLEDKSILTSQELELGETGRRDEPGPDYRLPSSLIPRHYVIRIRPMIDKDYPGVGSKNTARGNVRITVQCAESTNRVVLHQKFLTINETYIQVKNLADPDERIEVSNVEYDAARDFMILDLTTELRSPNNYDIFIPYIANVPPNDSLRGLYSESYLDPVTNETKVMAVTQLEPLRARQVFPSLDEPTYKATFDVIIGRTENFTSLANGALLSTEPEYENHLSFSFKSTHYFGNTEHDFKIIKNLLIVRVIRGGTGTRLTLLFPCQLIFSQWRLLIMVSIWLVVSCIDYRFAYMDLVT